MRTLFAILLQSHRLRPGVIVLALAIVALLTLGYQGGEPIVHSADAAPPQLILSNIRTVSVTASSATVAWTTNREADTVVEYGPTEALGTTPPPNPTLTKDHFISIGPLNQDTTYWYIVRSTDAASATVESTPRSFLTPASSGDTAPPRLSEIRVDSIDTIAVLHFKTNEPAKWEVRWGPTVALGRTNQQAAFGVVHQTNLPDPTTQPAAPVELDPNTLYYYEIQVSDGVGNQYTSAKFAFRTSGSAFDHVFTTGGCFDPGPPATTTPIGECKGLLFCDGGSLVPDCTKCGVTCPVGQTCTVASTGGGACSADPGLSGNAFQCNKDECYVGANFKLPALPSCWSTWPRCSANIVLKVQKDRVCDTWISCSESQEITRADTGTKDDLCVGVGACSSLGPGGTCNQFLGTGQCSNDPLRFCNSNNDCEPGNTCTTVISSTQHYRPITYRTPDDVSKIQNLTGSIVAGLDWGSATGVIEGQYPWFLAPQWGERVEIETGIVPKGDFEFPARTVNERRDSAAQAFASQNIDQDKITIDLEEQNLTQGQDNLNHVLKVTPRLDQNSLFEVPKGSFNAFPTLDYFVKFRIRTAEETNALRVQFATGGGTVYKTLKDLAVTSSWQEYQFGPVPGLNGQTTLRFYFLSSADGGTDETIFLDDLSISPVLETRPNEYVFPSCRLYPQADAEACKYISESGARYQGQLGYCLERDSKDPNLCIAWWPVDAIRGEENAFGIEKSAGYGGPFPTYMCVQSRLYAQGPGEFQAGCVDGGSGKCEAKDCNRHQQRARDLCRDLGGGLAPDGAPYYDWALNLHCGGICNRQKAADDCWFTCRFRPRAGVTEPPVTEFIGTVVPGSSLENRCAVVAKVADYGQNAAWSSRVQATSDYQVSPLKIGTCGDGVTACSNDADCTAAGIVPPTCTGSLALPATIPTPNAKYPVSTTPDTNGSYQVDYPFGRLVAPEPVTDPTQWALVDVRSTCTEVVPSNPLLCAGKNPAQVPGSVAGAASPYAVSAQSSGPTKLCNEGQNALRDAACNVGTCNPPAVGAPAECSQPTGTACTADQDCRFGANYRTCAFAAGATGTCNGDGVTACRLNKVCKNNTAIECTANPDEPDARCGGTCTDPDGSGPLLPGGVCDETADCAPLGTCVPNAASICTIPDVQCNATVTCELRANGVRQCSNDLVSTDGTSRCSDANGNPIAATSCTTDTDCAQTVEYCKEDTLYRTGRCTNAATGDVSTRRCTTDADCSRCLRPAVCLRAEDCYSTKCEPTPPLTGLCPNGTTACKSADYCYSDVENKCNVRTVCSNNSSKLCDNDSSCTVEACSTVSGRCQPISAVSVEVINTAVERLKRIFAQQHGVWYWDVSQNKYISCTGGVCGDFASAPEPPPNPYVVSPADANALLGLWVVPSTKCAGARDETKISDWCGFPPQVLNAKWKGGETFISINRGEQATLTFNTIADPDQKPLKRILIDWTGSGAIRTYEFPYDSKEDPGNPHVFRFAYSNTNPTASVTYTPRVLVMDNWGWCNNGATNDICKENVADWVPIGVSIEVD